MAKLMPVDSSSDDIYEFLAGKGTVAGNIIAPTLGAEQWGNLK